MTEQRLDFIAGQVQALLGFALAAIETHPSLALLEQHLRTVEQAQLVQTETTLVSEDFVEGLRDVTDRLLARAVNARARQADRDRTRRDPDP